MSLDTEFLARQHKSDAKTVFSITLSKRRYFSSLANGGLIRNKTQTGVTRMKINKRRTKMEIFFTDLTYF